MITSKDNPKMKRVRLLQADGKERRQEQVFVVEGIRLLEEVLDSGWEVEWLFYTAEVGGRGLALIRQFTERGVLVEEVSPSVMESVSDTQTPQGVLAVLVFHRLPLQQKLDFVLIPDGVRDPGNLGSMLRSAAAAGVQAVWLPPGAVDPFSPKVLRSAMGAHFRLPILTMEWVEIAEQVSRNSLCVYLADAEAEIDFTKADLRQPLALVVGSEAQGAGAQAHSLAVQTLKIPMPGGIESLNAAAAAAILMFEVVRQRQSTR